MKRKDNVMVNEFKNWIINWIKSTHKTKDWFEEWIYNASAEIQNIGEDK